jgi:hypothetical protein
MNLHKLNRATLMVPALVALIGIMTSQSLGAESSPKTVDKKFLLEKAPQRAAEVATTRKDAKDGQEVVVVGRVGGRKSPWVKNAAAFSIVDRSMKACNERPGDTCPTPWDFCCEADLPKSTLLVLVQDADGKLIKKDARELLGVKELDTVFIQGKVKRDKTGNVTLVADKLFVADKDSQNPAAEKKEAAK